MQQTETKQEEKSCGCLSEQGSIALLCVIKLIVGVPLHFFWWGLAMISDMDKDMRKSDGYWISFMLTFNILMMISSFVGLAGAYNKWFQLLRIFMIWDIAHCIYFGVTTLGLMILSVFVLVKGEDKVENYRWTQLIQSLICDASIIALSIIGSFAFIVLTSWSIAWHGKTRRFTKYAKSLVR